MQHFARSYSDIWNKLYDETYVYEIHHSCSGQQPVDIHNGVSAMPVFKLHFPLFSTLKLNMAAITADSLHVFPSAFVPLL